MNTQVDISFDDFKRGHLEAFEIYFNYYKKPLTFFAQSILKYHHETAEEIVSDTFLKLWDRRQDFETVQKIKAFLYIVTKNACLTFLNSSYVNKHVTLENLSEDALIEDPEIFAHLIRAETLTILSHEVEKLTATQKRIVQLSHFEDCNTKEIADRLQMAPNAVYVNYARAVKSLRKSLVKSKSRLFSFFL